MKQNNQPPKKNKSFFSTVLYSFLAIAISAPLLLTVFLTVNFSKMSVKSTQSHNQQLLSQTNYTINQMNENAERLAMSLLNNKDVIAFLNLKSMSNTMVPILASSALKNQLMVMPYVESIYLYNQQLDTIYSSKTGYQLSSADFEDKPIVERLTDDEFINSYTGDPLAIRKNEKNQPIDLISYIFFDSAKNSNEPKNALVINVYTSTLTDNIRSMKGFINQWNSDFVIMNQDGTVLGSVLNSELANNPDLFSELKEDTLADNIKRNPYRIINGKRYYQMVTHDNVNNWHLISLTPTSLLFHDLVSASLIGLLIMMIVLIFSFLVCLYFAKKLNNPLQMLVDTLKGHKKTDDLNALKKPEEFQLMLSVFSSLQEHNQQLNDLQRKTTYSLTQGCLNKLVSDNYIEFPEQIQQEMELLNLTYLASHTLCMAVLKIDGYRDFLKNHDVNELWAVRFSIVNISEEILSKEFTCNVISCDNDKFILFMDCQSITNTNAFRGKLTKLLHEIQKNIDTYLHFTVTIAYSTLFNGLEHIPSMYIQIKNTLNLKMKYGHNCIINPYMMDDIITEPFNFSGSKLDQLITKITSGNTDKALDIYNQLTTELFVYDYSEILSSIIYLSHTIYTKLSEKYIGLKEEFTICLKNFLTEIEYVEVADDVQSQMHEFITKYCDAIQELKNNPAQLNTTILAQKVCQIVEREFSNPSLCLSSISEEIGLSPNYTGKMFKQAMQKSVAQYILDQRMDKVVDYLKNTKLPLVTILENVGMEKNNYFYARFKKSIGISLNEFRAQCNSITEED